MGETDVLCAVLGAIRGRCEAAVAAEYRVVRGNSAKPWNPICPMLFRSMSMAAGDVSYGAALAVRKQGNCRHLMRLRIPAI